MIWEIVAVVVSFLLAGGLWGYLFYIHVWGSHNHFDLMDYDDLRRKYDKHYNVHKYGKFTRFGWKSFWEMRRILREVSKREKDRQRRKFEESVKEAYNAD